MSVTLTLKEYDEMQANKLLLTEQNKKLETAYEDNKKLQAEKVTALQGNDKTVTIIEKKMVMQSVYHPIPEYEIHSRMQRLVDSMIKSRRSQLPDYGPADGWARSILGALYEFTDMETTQETENVYSTALKDIKGDMKKDVKKELDAEIKRKLDAYDDLTVKLGQLEVDHDEIIKNNAIVVKAFEAEIQTLNKENEDHVINLEELEKENKELAEKVKELEAVVNGEDTKKVASLEAVILKIEYDTRVIPLLSGRDIAKKANAACNTVIKELNIEQL